MVPLDRGAVAAERGGGEPEWVGRIANVEQRDLGAEPAPFVGGVLADPEEASLTRRVQVGRVARDLQLAPHDRRRGIAQVDDVERVHLAERHDVGHVPEEPHGVDLLGHTEAADDADLLERRARSLQHADL